MYPTLHVVLHLYLSAPMLYIYPVFLSREEPKFQASTNDTNPGAVFQLWSVNDYFCKFERFFQSKWMSNTPEGIIDVHLEQIKNSVGSYFERN